MTVTGRPAAQDGSAYAAGRTAATVRAELGLDDVIALAANESPNGPLPSVAARLAEVIGEVHRYPEVRSATLLDELARFHGIEPERIVVGAGSAALIWQLAHSRLGPDSEVIAPAPSFEGYPVVARLLDAGYVPVPLIDHRVDIDELVAAITDQTSVVFVAEPNNPTGTAIGRVGLERLIEATADRCLLVIDEAYVEFNDHPDAVDAITIAGAHPHVLVLRTFSKAHGLAGLRVGYAVGSPQVCASLGRVAPPFSVNAVAQYAAITSLRAEAELKDHVAVICDERHRVAETLAARGFRIPDSRTNFVFVEHDAPELLARELEQRGVITRPIAGHGLRITIGTTDQNDRAVAALIEAVGPLPSHHDPAR